MKHHLALALAAALLAGCQTSGNLSASLGTMKNPQSPFVAPYGQPRPAVNPFFEANYAVLLRANDADPTRKVAADEMHAYLQAGFALADFYCSDFFRDADESQRRRAYGRAVTNDVGTAVAAVLGLANAGETAVAAAATAFGLADGLWRNYDEAFVVDADLANVHSLVVAAQENYEARATGDLPLWYSDGQRDILRYAHLCSTLGMRDLLNESARQQKTELDRQTAGLQAAGATTPNGD